LRRVIELNPGMEEAAIARRNVSNIDEYLKKR
jgi:hypothetical protein